MGTTSRRGAVTKFQEGLNGNLRDAFINCESGLQFLKASTQRLSVDYDTRFDFEKTSKFGASFIINPTTLVEGSAAGTIVEHRFDTGNTPGWQMYLAGSGGGLPTASLSFLLRDTSAVTVSRTSSSTLKVYLNNQNHCFIFYDGSLTSNNLWMFVNGKGELYSLDASGLGSIINNSALGIGSNGTAIPFDGIINNVVVYDFNTNTPNAAKLQEIADYLTDNGGISHPDTFEHIVDHWTLTERYAYDDGVDNLFFDVVEQYNYAKPPVSNSWTDSGASYNIGLSTTGDYFEVTYQDGQYMRIGVSNPENVPTSATDLGYYISIDTSGADYRGTGASVSSLGGNYVNTPGDIIRFEKNGNDLELYINAVLRYTWVGVATVTLYPQLNFFNTNCELSSINLNGTNFKFTSTRNIYSLVGTAIKSSALQANHAKAINFTDSELGVVNPSTQTAKKDFYNKNTLFPLGYYFDGTKNGTMASATSIGISGSWTFTVKYNAVNRPYSVSGSNSILWSGASNSTLFLLRATGGGTSKQTIQFQFLWTQGAANQTRAIFTYSDADLATAGQLTNRSIYLTIRKTGTTVEYFVNGVKQGFSDTITFDATTLQANTTWASRDTGTEKIQGTAISGSQWNSSALTDNEIFDLHRGQGNDTNLVFRHNWAASGGTAVVDETGTHDITMSAAADQLIDFKSALPEIKQAFELNGTSHYFKVDNFAPTKEIGYTYLIGYSLDSDRNYDFPNDALMSMRTGTGSPNKQIVSETATKMRCKSIGGGANLAIVDLDKDSIRLNDINFATFRERDGSIATLAMESFINGFVQNQNINGTVVINDFSSINSPLGTNPLYIGADVNDLVNRLFTGSMYLFAIWKGFVPREQLLRIINNTLPVNPTSLDGEDYECQLYLNFNEGSFSEDGTNVLLKDWSSFNHNVKAIGLTGATSADQLADVPNHLVDINSLR